jgi:hypothetical protein
MRAQKTVIHCEGEGTTMNSEVAEKLAQLVFQGLADSDRWLQLKSTKNIGKYGLICSSARLSLMKLN